MLMMPMWKMTDLPPTLYSLLNAIVNFGADEKTKIKDLASAGHETIFNFTYPLSTKVNKAEFETNILNHYLMRRIGFDTLTAFQIHLNSKLNSIMPIYNKMFEMLDGWDLFNDGETITRNVYDETSSNVDNTTNGYTVNDSRNSDMPQGELSNVRDAKYVTNYSYDQNNNRINANTKSGSTGNTRENTFKTPSDKIRIYKEFIENRESIYDMIYKELDSLFYGLV